MTFNSVEYAVFLACVLLLYWAAHPRLRPWILLVSSVLFYGTWGWQFVPLLVFSTVVSWAAGLAIPRASTTRRRWLLALSVGSSVAIVVAFKTINVLLGGSAAGGGIGMGATSLVQAVVIPVGLSFYSFQVISYVIDVARGDAEPEQSFVTYAVYVTFFPHLLAGPIVRARRLIPQLHNRRRRPEPVMFTEGLQLLFLGLFKKVAVADVLVGSVQPYITNALQGDQKIGTPMVLIGQLLVLLGNFFDISGYIDMARGSAKLFGIRMPPAFGQPLTRSRSWTDFWRRWQIPIMGWFRDYVYRPVRSSSRTGGRETAALFATFLAAGLWHGLTPGWLVWGAITAAILVVERQTGFLQRRSRPASRARTAVRRVGRLAYVFACLLLTTPWAGAADVGQTLALYRHLVTAGLGTLDPNLLAFAVYGVVVLVLSDRFDRHLSDREGFRDPVGPLRALAFGGMLVAILVFSGTTAQQFVYFQF